MGSFSLYWDIDDDVEDIRGSFPPIHLGDVVFSQKGQYRVLHCAQARTRHLLYSMAGRDTPRTIMSPSTSLLTHLYYIYSQRSYVALKICIADADPNHELHQQTQEMLCNPPQGCIVSQCHRKGHHLSRTSV